MPNIYVLRGDEFHETLETPYETESVLQQLIAQYPNLLAGDQFDDTEARRWLLLDKEGRVGRWAVDHLFVDQDAVPTIVEVKRSTDTRIRREVVGQMLDYAANAVIYWSVDDLRERFNARCEAKGDDPDECLVGFLGVRSAAAFWETMAANLDAGRIRLVFIADTIPAELQRVVEYLNEQMRLTRVIAVEVKQYVGDGVKALVPRVVGETAKARAAKAGARSDNRSEPWDRESFLAALIEENGPEIGQLAAQILRFCEERLPHWWWGRGKRGSVFPGINRGRSRWFPCSLWTDGSVEIPFQWLRERPPFDSVELRHAYRERLSRVSEVSLPADSLEGRSLSDEGSATR